MKCALIIPAWQPDELFPAKTAGSQINYWQPLGTLYVAASLKQAGHEVRFYNGAFLTHEAILQSIAEYQPQLVGIYATTFGWPKAQITAKEIRAVARDCFICVGGPFPIAWQERCLSENIDYIDGVITGEGEVTLLEICNRLSAGDSLQGVDGLVFQRHGEVTSNAPRALIEDLDVLPFPARELLGDSARYLPPPATYQRQPVAVMITSRGCDRRCIFCSQIDKHRKSGRRGIRFRSVDNVIAEIRQCLQQGYREIKFIDDTLAADYDRLMRLTREIKRQKLDFTWFASACVNQVDKPLLRAMKDAGCWAILMGAESGVQKNLNTLRKAITLDQIRSAVKAAKDVGLVVSTPFLFGIPGETYEEALQTIDFALELNPDLANFHALTAFPGTHLYENRDKYGRVSENLSRYTYQGASFESYTLSSEQIHALRQFAFRRFYSRPSFLLKRLLRMRNKQDLQAAVNGVKSLLALWSRDSLFSGNQRQRASIRGEG